MYLNISIILNFKKYLFLIILIISYDVLSDSFDTNTYNNHGVVGLINTPSARFYDEGVHGVTVYDGTPNQKITLSSNGFLICLFEPSNSPHPKPKWKSNLFIP